MSKSDPNDASRINLTDDADTIAKKISKAKTDTSPFPSNPSELENRPEITNLITIYSALSGDTPQAIMDQFAGPHFSPFKKALADLAIDKLSPIAKRLNELLADQTEIDRILADGAQKANAIAQPVVKAASKAMGFWPS